MCACACACARGMESYSFLICFPTSLFHAFLSRSHLETYASTHREHLSKAVLRFPHLFSLPPLSSFPPCRMLPFSTACLGVLTASLTLALSLAVLVSAASPGGTLISASFSPVVEDVVSAFLAPFPAVIGGAAYVGRGQSICVAANSTASTLPLTYQLSAQLFGSVGAAVLDPLHGCYLNQTRSCAGWLASTPDECGGRVADAMSAGAAEAASQSQDGHAFTTSAAALAGLVGRDTSAFRILLSRSLRRTREVNVALDTLRDLVLGGVASASDAAEAMALNVSMSERAAALVLAHHATVMEKYDLLLSWLPWSLGAGGDSTSNNMFVQPDALPCGTADALTVLLSQDVPTLAVVRNVQDFGALGDEVGRNRTLFPDAERALLCVQAHYMFSVATVEDSRIRGLHAMLANGTLSSVGAWPSTIWTDYIALNVTDLTRRTGTVLESVLMGVGIMGIFGESETSPRVSALIDCLSRAVLQAPNPATRVVPPSLTWCYDQSLAPAHPGAVVPGNGFAHADPEAGMPECPIGWSVFDGGCGGTRTCTLCPSGTAADTTEVCNCVNASTYGLKSGGCEAKGPAGAPPQFTWAGQPDGTVVLSGESGNATELATLTIPASSQVNDPSAFLSLSVVCDQGLTVFRATPFGSRKAVCLPTVVYQRHAERTGTLQATGAGLAATALTYAQSLKLEVVSSGAIGGDSCTVSAYVGSALRRPSSVLLVGKVRVVPRAAAMRVSVVAVPSTGPLACDAVAAATAGEAALGEIRVGQCVVSGNNALALFVDARGYRVLSDATLTSLLSGTAVGRNRTQLADLVGSTAGRVGLHVSLLGPSDRTTGRSVWTPGGEGGESLGGSWQPLFVLPVGKAALMAAESVQVAVLDVNGGALLGTAAAWTRLTYSEPQLPSSRDSSSSDSTTKDTEDGKAALGYAVGFASVCAMLLIATVILCVLTADLCCGGARPLPKRSPRSEAGSVGEDDDRTSGATGGAEPVGVLEYSSRTPCPSRASDDFESQVSGASSVLTVPHERT